MVDVVDPPLEKLEARAKAYRLNSISESTRKSREMQWRCYVKACKCFGWTLFPCDVNQACLYVTYLAERLKFSSVTSYYQAVIFYHVCVGIEPVRMSNPVLKATLKGIERDKGQGEIGKDPMLPHHLRELVKVVDLKDDIEILVLVAAIVMFRTLLRVSHVVFSPHTLRIRDLRFKGTCCILSIHSSKTKGIGPSDEIPITESEDGSICACRWSKFLLHKFKMGKNCYLFSSPKHPKLTYSVFSKKFKVLIRRAELSGDFASHSLRRGGATFMSMLNCPVSQIKERGRWKSDCVYRYIKPPLD